MSLLKLPQPPPPYLRNFRLTHNDTKVYEEYCWAITQATGWGRSVTDPVPSVPLYIHATYAPTLDHMYTQFELRRTFLWLSALKQLQRPKNYEKKNFGEKFSS